MNKSDLIIKVAEKLNLENKEAKKIINIVFNELSKGLINNKKAVLPEIGILYLKEYKERSGVHSLLGEKLAWKKESHKKVKLRLTKSGKKIGN